MEMRLRMRTFQLLELGISLSACLLLLTACMLPVPPTPTPSARPTATQQVATPSLPSGSSAQVITQNWQKSKHANTYVADKGNAGCALCHSPSNWVPASIDEMPKTCASCKFSVPIPPQVAQTDWNSVTCDTCHRVENGTASAQIAFSNVVLQQYDTSAEDYVAVKTTTELCEKCHTDAKNMSAKVDLGKGAHSNMLCTNCHDAHSSQASCTAANCHANVVKPEKPIQGHDTAHAKVSCGACHDASGLKVGPADDGQWVTLRTMQVGGKQSSVAYTSHNLQRQVDCARCHFEGNPWGLKLEK